MPEQELDLFEFAAGNMAESSAGATQIVGRNLLNPDTLREIPNDVPDHLFGYAISPDPPRFIDRPKQHKGSFVQHDESVNFVGLIRWSKPSCGLGRQLTSIE